MRKSGRPLLSAALIVRNEERHLDRCLASIRPLVDEIVVVDTGSKDASMSIARHWKARVSRFRWQNDFAAARNRALDLARGEWILYIDADEHVVRGRRGAIVKTLREPANVGARVLLHPLSGHTAYPELRLFRNDPLIRFSGVIHENIWPAIERFRARRGGVVVDTDVTLEHRGYEGDQLRKHRRNLPLLRRSVRADPGRVFDWCHLARVHAALGKPELAERAWSGAMRVVRRTSRADAAASVAYSGYVEFRMARGKRVQPLLDEAIARFPRNLHLLWLRALARIRSHRYAEAIEAVEAMRSYVARDDYDHSIAYDRRLLDLWPLEALARCHYSTGNYRRSAHFFGLASLRDPDRREFSVKRDLCRRLARTAGA